MLREQRIPNDLQYQGDHDQTDSQFCQHLRHQ